MIREYLKLIRPFNLVMIAGSQVLIHYLLIQEAFKTESLITGNYPPHLTEFNFYLLVFSTILIAAGGNAINDYFDINIDEINKPGKNQVGKTIPSRSARMIYYLFSATGVLAGFYLAIIIGRPVIGFVPLFAAVSLWMYSSHYKRRFFSGNIIISLLCALSILLPGLYEPEFYRNFNYILWYAIFAFLLTLIREIIKDAEDVDGDERSQCKTIPIILGIRTTKIILAALIMALIAWLSAIIYSNFEINSVIDYRLMIAMFSLPLAGLFYLIVTAEEKKDFHYASLFCKGIMAAGILTIIPFWYYFLR